VNLLVLNYEYPPVGGGAATASRCLARALVARGHSVAVIASGMGADVGSSVEDGVAVLRLDVGRARADRSTTWEMARYVGAASRVAPEVVRARGIDGVVAFFSVPCGPVARRIARRFAIPYVVSLRGADVPGHAPEARRMHALVGFFRRRVLRDAAAVVANSASLAELARRADGGAVEVVPNGVDAEFFTPPASPPPEPFRLLFVGRLHPQKNPGFVVDALAALRARTSAPVALDVVGDGPLAAELRERATALGVADSVRWHGWLGRAALRDRYRGAHCFVSSSPREGMPNAVLEAMACGLPVLATRVPGHEEVVRHGETGYLVALDGADEFVNFAERLAADADLRARLGREARRVAASEYSWDRAAQAYVEFLARGRSDGAGGR
jgi:glycosyltransferase involved in cell wall biosynthesis